MSNRKPIAVITGATGGIGTEFAKQLAAQKYHIILSDRDDKRLTTLAHTLHTDYKASTEIINANLADATSVAALAQNLMERKRIDMLVNAAGYGEKKLFKDESNQSSMDMISVHVLATVQLVHAVLPAMLKRKRGAIIAVSSLAAVIPAPGSSIYAATKSFINTFMESLEMEVHERGIRVQSLCPGLTHTGFHTQQDIDRFKAIKGLNLWMEAKEVVATSLSHLEEGYVICVPGFVNQVIKKGIPLLPRHVFYKLVEKLSAVPRVG